MKTENINKIVQSINSLSDERKYISNEMVYRNVKGDGISREHTEEILKGFVKTGDLGKGQRDNRGLYIIRHAPLEEYNDIYSQEFGRSFVVSEPLVRFST